MRRIAGAVLMLGVAAAAWAGEGTVRRSPNAIKDEYIVVLRDDTPREQVPEIARRLGQQYRGEVVRVWRDAIKGFHVRMSAAQAEGLSHHPDVKFIEENAEMFLSASVPTNVDPACDPSPGNPCTTTDNRLWHLDVMDQNSAVATNDYSYCETGSGVYVYVIDTGVARAHREFGNDPNRVLDGYDATGDPAWFPAHDPCRGFAPFTQGPDGQVSPFGVRAASHGTGVASLVAGNNVGVARGAKIVPIKISPCGKDGARRLSSDTPNTHYALGEIVYAHSNYYKVVRAGYTGPAGTYPTANWPLPPGPSCCQTWNEVKLEYVGPLPRVMSVAMTTEGLDWILRPVAEGGNPHPKSPAVVTLSTYRLLHEAGVTSGSPSLEGTIGNLLTYNNGQGITVIASANNQDSTACDTTPGRMSRNNPGNPNDQARPYKVITAGGTMVRNNPDPNPATGGPHVGLAEPLYDETQQTILARWRCHAGDSAACSTNIYNNPSATPSATDPAQRTAYYSWNLGSNGGPCVTLFAPAKNITVAALESSTSYRDSRATGGNASGTSWSAPIVAGMVARILQNNQTYSVDQVYNALMARTAPDLRLTELDPPGVTGTPNAVLRMTPVVVQPLARVTPLGSNGSATITVAASGAASLTYQLYQVNASFDVATYDRGAASSTPMGLPQTSNSFTVAPTSATSYFVRVRSSCGSADTTITTVTTISAPAGVVATASGATVTISWNEVSNAGGYKVERKIGSGAWETAQTVSSGATTSVNDTPAVPSGVVLYRVRATQGSAQSDPSGNDVAYTLAFTDDPVLTFAPYTKIKAVHIIEVRRAVNALRELAGAGAVYAGNDLDEAYMKTLAVDDAHFTTLMANLNSARQAVSLPSVGFVSMPQGGGAIDDTHLANLRSGVK